MKTNSSEKLSFDKLVNLLDRNNYILEKVYCQGQNILFVECKTPKYQKTFILYIPRRYVMIFPEDSSIKKLEIKLSNDQPSTSQIQFMSEMKGTLLECDTLVVSSEILCRYPDNGKIECFYFNEEGDEEEEEKEEKDEDEVSSLERKTSNLIKKIDPDAEVKIDNKEEVIEDELIEEEGGFFEGEEELPEEEEEEIIDEKVELVFEDDEDTLDKSQLLNNPEKVEDSLNRIKEKIENESSENKEKEHKIRDNALPENIQDGEIFLGIIYVLIDINKFFKIISNYEEEVLKCYDQIDENEEDIRKKRLSNLKELLTRFSSHAEEKLKNISSEEEKLKMQLIRLTIVLTQADGLKNKTETNPSKYDPETVAETKRIYEETRETIHDINMEILRLRDKSEELLKNYNSTVIDLMKL